MFNLFNKGRLVALLALVATSSSLMAWDCCDEEPSCNRFYVGGFGGGLYSNSNKVYQYGTAFFPEREIGPLPVLADGHLKKTSTGFGGVQLGYEWTKPLCSGWSIATAGEAEVFFFQHKKKGHLVNHTVVGLPEHDFKNSLHSHSCVILLNAVFSFNSDCLWGLTPYVGGGIGATRVSLHKANSYQVEPAEPGINHFNSNRSDSTWAFAAQAKVGLRYNFCEKFHIFGEYRYLYVDAANYILGATNYRTHVPTTAWNVKVRNVSYNAFAFGVQYDL